MKHACSDIELLLAEFAADELDDLDAARVAGHVAICDACRAELGRESALRRTLAGLPVHRGPDVHLPTATPTGSPARRLRTWLPVAGGLIAAAVVLAMLIPGDRSPLPDAPGATAGAPDAAPAVADIRRDARTSLILAARILERSERHTVADVFGRHLPHAISGSLRSGAEPPEGGQG